MIYHIIKWPCVAIAAIGAGLLHAFGAVADYCDEQLNNANSRKRK